MRIAERGAVDEEQVETAVAVVIEHRHAARHGLDQVLLRGGAAVALEFDARLHGDVAKYGSGSRGRALRGGGARHPREREHRG